MDMLSEDTIEIKIKNFNVCANDIDDLTDHLQKRAHDMWEESMNKGITSMVNSEVLTKELLSVLEKSINGKEV